MNAIDYRTEHRDGYLRSLVLPGDVWDRIDLLAVQMSGTPADVVEVLLRAAFYGRDARQAVGA